MTNPIDVYLFGQEEQDYLNDIDQCDTDKQKYVNEFDCISLKCFVILVG